MAHKPITPLPGVAALVVALLLAVSACSETTPSEPVEGPSEERAHEVSEREGPYSRLPCNCIQDLFLQIGDRVPGFGGFWLEGSAAVVGVTDLALADTARAEARVFFHEDRRERLGLEDEIQVVELEYGFRQLAAWGDSVFTAGFNEFRVVPCPESERGMCSFISGLGVNEGDNRVKIWVMEENYVRVVEEWAEGKGIPRGALDIKAYRGWIGPFGPQG